MNYFRLSKYNPIYRVNGIYQKQEWTSYSDIGKIYDNQKFLESEYLSIEQQYIDTIIEIAVTHNIDKLAINHIENYDTKWNNKKLLSLFDTTCFIRDCLRDLCWGQLVSDGFIWEVGYDYYMHLGCNSTFDTVECIAKKHNLFVESWESIQQIR